MFNGSESVLQLLPGRCPRTVLCDCVTVCLAGFLGLGQPFGLAVEDAEGLRGLHIGNIGFTRRDVEVGCETHISPLFCQFGLAVEHGLPTGDEVVRLLVDVLYRGEQVLHGLPARCLTVPGLGKVLCDPGGLLCKSLHARDCPTLGGHCGQRELRAEVQLVTRLTEHGGVVEDSRVETLGDQRLCHLVERGPRELPRGAARYLTANLRYLGEKPRGAHAGNQRESVFGNVPGDVPGGYPAPIEFRLLCTGENEAADGGSGKCRDVDFVVRVPSLGLVPALEILGGAVEVLVELPEVLEAHLVSDGAPLVLRAVLPVVRVVRVREVGPVVVRYSQVVSRGNPESLHILVQGVQGATVHIRPGATRGLHEVGYPGVADGVVFVHKGLVLFGKVLVHNRLVEPENILEDAVVLRDIGGQLFRPHILHIEREVLCPFVALFREFDELLNYLVHSAPLPARRWMAISSFGWVAPAAFAAWSHLMGCLTSW